MYKYELINIFKIYKIELVIIFSFCHLVLALRIVYKIILKDEPEILLSYK